MKRVFLAIMGVAVMSLGAHTAAFAGGGSSGGPVVDPGEDPGDPGDGGPGDGGGGGGGTGTGGGSTSALGTAPPPGTFDLETIFPHPGSTGLDAYNASSISPIQTLNGVTLSLASTGDTAYGLANEGLFSYLGVEDATVGAVSLFEFGFGASVGEIYANFSTQLSAVSLLAFKITGTYSPTVTLIAYSGVNGTGDVLGSTSGSFGGAGYQADTFSLTGLAGARSIGFHADTRGNVWFDNFQIDAVPEPSTWALMLGGFGLTGGALRRRR
ncbi:MAG: PEPxxWA-CTERM sorting domain-containing protein, partial [Alphaproteobacteria bacterium]|nr:PEPxxWA-CTERM sorting domain-containing protein [Alphaproteobacteria bacterium]